MADVPNNESGVLRFKTKKREQIYDALVNLHPEFGPQVAGVYAGMLVAEANKANPERHAHVSHSVRELTTILPLFFEGLPVADDGGGADSEPGHLEKLKRLVYGHASRRSLPRYQRDAFAKSWFENHLWFVIHSHHPLLKNKESKQIDEGEFSRRLALNEEHLYQVLVKPPFFEPFKELDAMLKVDKPSDGDVATLARLISHEKQNAYFFERCENPSWLAPLLKCGAFTEPPDPTRKDGYIQFFGWPESGYLARIAPSKPSEVFEVIWKIQTDNQAIRGDFLKAALGSAPAIAAKYVRKIKRERWLDLRYHSRLPFDAAELMVKLVEASLCDEALDLAGALFAIKEFRRKASTGNEFVDSINDRSDAKPFYDEWQFTEILNKKTAGLAAARPVDFFNLLVKKLYRAESIEARDVLAEKYQDYSHIWRPNLFRGRREHEDAKDAILSKLVEIIEANKNDAKMLREFAVMLASQKLGIFKRLELYVYSLRPDEFKSEIEAALCNEDFIRAFNLRKEYILLLRQNFGGLSEESKEKILAVVDGGLTLKEYASNWAAERKAEVQNQWKATYLLPIKELLPKATFQKHESILGGEWSEEEFLSEGEMRTWPDEESPLTVDDIGAMDVGALMDYLGAHKPTDSLSRFSSSGLGSSLATVVSMNPSKYTPAASQLLEKKVRPIYVYHFLNGLHDALKAGHFFEWDDVLKLCSAILGKNGEKELGVPANEHEQDWQSVRKAMANLMREALGRKGDRMPFSERGAVWPILKKLSDDEQPTPEDERRDGGGNLDPMTLSINTVRGEAMHAVVDYGLWHSKHAPKEYEGPRMPAELKEVLEAHLKIDIDPSLSTRAVYGWRLPNIAYLDSGWVASKKDEIFPDLDKQRPFFVAALQGYLSNNVFDDLTEIFLDKLSAAIAILGTLDKGGYHGLDIDERLPQHIMIIFVRDAKHESLADHFFEKAPTKARAEAINFLGRQVLDELPNLENKLSVTPRLLGLWKKRLSEASDLEELQEFGWWVSRSPFGKETTINLLIDTLKKTKGAIEAAYEVIEALVGYSTDMPIETITALQLIADGAKENHEIDYKFQEYRDIITTVMKSDSSEAKKKAADLIHSLGERGFLTLRDLSEN